MGPAVDLSGIRCTVCRWWVCCSWVGICSAGAFPVLGGVRRSLRAALIGAASAAGPCMLSRRAGWRFCCRSSVAAVGGCLCRSFLMGCRVPLGLPASFPRMIAAGAAAVLLRMIAAGAFRGFHGRRSCRRFIPLPGLPVVGLLSVGPAGLPVRRFRRWCLALPVLPLAVSPAAGRASDRLPAVVPPFAGSGAWFLAGPAFHGGSGLPPVVDFWPWPVGRSARGSAWAPQHTNRCNFIHMRVRAFLGRVSPALGGLEPVQQIRA